jgi:hypothetical protein
MSSVNDTSNTKEIEMANTYACPTCGIEVVDTDICCWSCGARLVEHGLDLGDDDARCDLEELDDLICCSDEDYGYYGYGDE